MLQAHIPLLKTIRVELFDRFDPQGIFLRQAIRTMLAAAVAIALYRLRTDWIEGGWIIFAAVFIMQTRIGTTQREAMTTVALSGFSAAVSAYCAVFFVHHTLLLAGYLALITFACIYIGLWGPKYVMVGFTVNLFAIMSAGFATSAAGQAERFFLIILGTGVALIMSLLWPQKLIGQWRTAIKACFECLAEFSELVSNSYLDPDYAQNVSRWKNKLYERRDRGTRLLNFARDTYTLIEKNPAIDPRTLERYHSELIQAERLYVGIVALSNLRHRFTLSEDLAPLRQELSTIHELTAALAKDPRTQVLNPKRADDLHRAIQSLRATIHRHPIELQLAIDNFVNTATNVLADFKKDRLENQKPLCSRPDTASRSVQRMIYEKVSMLIGNLNTRNIIYRKATRMAITVFACVCLYRYSGIMRGFWIPLTVIIVMQDTTAATLRKGIQRAIGTLIGIAIGSFLVLCFKDFYLLNIVLLLSIFITFYMKALAIVNYGIFAVSVTIMVIFLIANMIPEQTDALMIARLYDTGLGAFIGVISTIFVLPYSLKQSVQNGIEEIIRVQFEYLVNLLESLLIREEDSEASLIALQRSMEQCLSTNRMLYADWVYEIVLRLHPDKDYNQFLDLEEKIAQWLFALDYLARNKPRTQMPAEVHQVVDDSIAHIKEAQTLFAQSCILQGVDMQTSIDNLKAYQRNAAEAWKNCVVSLVDNLEGYRIALSDLAHWVNRVQALPPTPCVPQPMEIS